MLRSFCYTPGSYNLTYCPFQHWPVSVGFSIDFPLDPLCLWSSNEKYHTSMSLQCSVLRRRALLAVNLWQILRLAGNRTWLPFSSTMKSDGFDQPVLPGAISAALPALRSSGEKQHTDQSAHKTYLISVIKRHLINQSVTWPGLAWRDIFHSWVDLAVAKIKMSPSLPSVPPCDSLEHSTRQFCFGMSRTDLMVHYTKLYSRL